MDHTTSLAPDLQAATETLADNLLSSEPLVRHRQAQAALQGDAIARKLLASFSAAQADVRRRQARGGVTQADIEQLRALQRQVQANAVIMHYAETQQGVIAYLREVNQEISQWLGVDFASLARRSGCC